MKVITPEFCRNTEGARSTFSIEGYEAVTFMNVVALLKFLPKVEVTAKISEGERPSNAMTAENAASNRILQ